MLGVYAGSYYNVDDARRYEDWLFKKGVHVQEVKAELSVPLSILRFGAFTELAAARKAAARARAAGLQVELLRVR